MFSAVAHSGVIRSQAWLTFPLLGAPPSESVGGGMTLPLVSARRMPGAEVFSSLFYAELEWSAAVVVHVGEKNVKEKPKLSK